jgi:hypothetical protein
MSATGPEFDALKSRASLACVLLLFGAGAACAQSVPVPGPATDIYAGTREYRWTFYVPVMTLERHEVVFSGPGMAVHSRRFDYEVPGLKSERRKLGQVAEFYCKYPDWQLPNECGIQWHDVYADLPVLALRHEHVDADVAEWTTEERRIRLDVPRWTWQERTLTVVVPEFSTVPPPQRTWSMAPGPVLADASLETARATLDSRQAEAVQAIDAAVAALTSNIESVETQGASASKLTSSDGTSIDLYATRQALLDEKISQVARYTRIRSEMEAAATRSGGVAEAR